MDLSKMLVFQFSDSFFNNQLIIKLRSKFESLRREINADVKKQYELYVNNLVGNIKTYPRDFYWYINIVKKDTQGIPAPKRRNGSGLAESELEQADEFNSHFMDVFNKVNTPKSRSLIARLLSWFS